jgi:YD repeat-containing protein
MDGRQVGVLDAERYLTQYVYDAAGRRTLAVRYGTIPASVAQQTSSTFESIRTTVNGGARLTTYYFYDAEGRQVGVVNEQGFLTAINYDAALNRRQTVQYLTPVTVSESNTLATAVWIISSLMTVPSAAMSMTRLAVWCVKFRLKAPLISVHRVPAITPLAK